MEGKLTIILGYAAGVGKTYRMLEEGRRLASEGLDVVIGYFEPHGRADTIALSEDLETVPRRKVNYRGKQFEEMDPESILRRKPALCLVDEFPHTNVPGSGRVKRWEDVLALMDAGIDVMTTMNIQHLESLNDDVREVSGVKVRETVPDWVVKRASEVVMVDLTPGALLNRLDRGVVYSPEKARHAREHFFREPTLAALREMALRQTAHEVDLRHDSTPELVRERILIHVTDSPSSVGLIRRGRRVADYLRADCFAVAVSGQGHAEEEALQRHLDFARRLHIETRVLDADDPAEALFGFAQTNGITQIFIAKPPRARIPLLAGKHRLLMELLQRARGIQVTIVADRRKSTPER